MMAVMRPTVGLTPSGYAKRYCEGKGYDADHNAGDKVAFEALRIIMAQR